MIEIEQNRLKMQKDLCVINMKLIEEKMKQIDSVGD